MAKTIVLRLLMVCVAMATSVSGFSDERDERLRRIARTYRRQPSAYSVANECKFIEKDVRSLEKYDELRDQFADAAEQAIIEQFYTTSTDLSKEGFLELRKAARSLDPESAPFIRLPPAIREKFTSALLGAFAELIKELPIAFVQGRLEDIHDRVKKLDVKRSPPPPLPALSGRYDTCAGLRSTLEVLNKYFSDWFTWEVENGVHDDVSDCTGLDPDGFARLAASLKSIEEPMAHLGLALDAVQPGTSNSTAYLSACLAASDKAEAIERDLARFRATARSVRDGEKKRFKNLHANVLNLVGPSAVEICEKEEKARLEEIRQRIAQEAVEADRRRKLSRRVKVVTHSLGSFERQGSSNVWKEYHRDNPNVFTFQERSYEEGVVHLIDPSRSYLLNLPTTQNACMVLSYIGGGGEPCLYRVQGVTFINE